MIFPYLTLSTMFYKVVIKKLYVSELNACLFYIIVVSYERSESKVNLELPCSFPCLVLKPLRLYLINLSDNINLSICLEFFKSTAIFHLNIKVSHTIIVARNFISFLIWNHSSFSFCMRVCVYQSGCTFTVCNTSCCLLAHRCAVQCVCLCQWLCMLIFQLIFSWMRGIEFHFSVS